MKIKLERVDKLDWFRIVRKEHDGREWLEEVRKDCFQYMRSDRLSPEACIEGDADEMWEVAQAIINKEDVHFKRVEVSYTGDGFFFESPKNSSVPVLISVEDATEFAKQVIGELT